MGGNPATLARRRAAALEQFAGRRRSIRRFPPPWSIEELDACFLEVLNLPPLENGVPLIANIVMQIGLVVCTGLGFLLTSLKLPHYGVIANLIGQVFWLYSSYRAWREADQIGIFISTVIITLILIYGVTNYWLFGEKFSVKGL